MQKTKAIALALAITAMLGMGGCSTTYTKEQVLEKFEPGESTIYIINRAVRKNLTRENICGQISQKDERIGQDFVRYYQNEMCPKIETMQLVSGFYYTHPIKGMRMWPAYAPLEMDIGVDDILKLTIDVNPDGSYRRPALVEKLVKKDGAKEPADCNWEGGRSATTAFLSGGVVCEGWDWKKQKFAQ